MNWGDIESNDSTKAILNHWQKLGKFRKNHPSVGAGSHTMISESPYVFKRTYDKEGYSDEIIVGLDLEKGAKSITVADTFPDDIELRDAYSGAKAMVYKGSVSLDTPFTIVLLERTTK